MLNISSLDVVRDLIMESMIFDSEVLDTLREEIRVLDGKVNKIHSRNITSLSIVGTDGGNNNLRFDPFIVHVIRVVDSSNNEYYMDVITPTTPVKGLNNKIQSGVEQYDSLRRMMDYLGVDDLTKLSPMIRDNPPDQPISPSWVQVYRELVEWATLFSLVRDKEYGSDTLLVFDGFLRSKVFSKDLFHKLRKGIEDCIRQHWERSRRRIYIVGVAKRSKVLERYGLVIHLDGMMDKQYPCYMEIPREIEEKAYRWSEYARGEDLEGQEINKFVAGKMFFVKFGGAKGDPIWPVDIFIGLENEAQNVLGSLLADAQVGFPIPFYPLSLQRAHENAALVDFDMEMIQNHILDSIRKVIGDESSRLDSFLLRAKDSSAARYNR